MSLLDRLASRLNRYGDQNAALKDRDPYLPDGPEFAALERLLATLEAEVSSFATCEVAAGDTLHLKGTHRPFLHYVLKGSGFLRVEGGDEIAFAPHAFIIVPPGRKQALETQKRSSRQVEAMEQSVAIVDHMLRISSSETAVAEVVTTCGTIEASYHGSVGVFDHLDGPISLQLERGDPLRQAFEVLLDELASPRFGTRALTEALLKQCLILLIRRMAPDDVGAAWLFGTADTRLLRPVLTMLDSPGGNFTIDQLAKTAGMSRSSFAAKFQDAFGTSPIEFLKTIRLRHAARLLDRTTLSVDAIAKSVGYESRTYFSRAFRGLFGLSPRAFRAESRDSVQPGRGRSE